MTVITNANLPVSNGSGDAALAHIQSNRVIGSTTIATDTISNWPANFIATTGTLLSSGFIDPTSKTDFYGHLGVGNQLIIDGFCPGNADNGNTSGQVVVIKPNTEWANLIANGVQSTSNFPSIFANFVEPAAGIWSIVSGLAGTQTVGNVWYQGVRYSIPAVASNTFTASKDTYVDVNPATGAYTYVPVANLATEPAVTASCVRVAKIVTGASAITSISQAFYNTPTVQSAIANAGIWWQELGRNTLTVAGTTLTVNFTAKKYLRLQIQTINGGSSSIPTLRFNNDSGANYSLRLSDNGAADGTFASQTGITLHNGTDGAGLGVVDIGNILAIEKAVTSLWTNTGGGSSAGLPSRRTSQSKWANATVQINRVDIVGSANIAVGSELVVLGHD